MSDKPMWAVRIHETRGHTLYVRADTIEEAYGEAHDRWYRGDDGDDGEEESVGYEIVATKPAPNRTEVSSAWLDEEEATA